LVFAELMYRGEKVTDVGNSREARQGNTFANPKLECGKYRRESVWNMPVASIVNPHYHHNYYAKNIMRGGSLPEYSRDPTD